MKKILSILLVLALALACSYAAFAETPEVTIEQLKKALSPVEMLKNGPFSVTKTYYKSDDESIDGMTNTLIYAKNGEYYELNDFMSYPNGFETKSYYSTDPADPVEYSLRIGVPSAFPVPTDTILEMVTAPVFDIPETVQISEIEIQDDVTEVIITDENDTGCMLMLDEDGRVVGIVAIAPADGDEVPVSIIYVLDYSEDIAIDYSPKEANAGYELPYLDIEGGVNIETTDINGDPVSADLIAEAKLVMVNLWEPWCGPCVGEMPDLQRLYEAYRDQGLVILGVYSYFDMDAKAKEIVEENGITYPILRCNESLAELAQDYVPATFFLNARGEILTPTPFSGAASYETWETRVLEYLNK